MPKTALILVLLLPTCAIADNKVGFSFIFVPEPQPRPQPPKPKLSPEEVWLKEAKARVIAQRIKEDADARDAEVSAAARQRWVEWLRNRPPVDPEKDEYARWLRNKQVIDEFGGPPPDEFEKWRAGQPEKPKPKKPKKTDEEAKSAIKVLENGIDSNKPAKPRLEGCPVENPTARRRFELPAPERAVEEVGDPAPQRHLPVGVLALDPADERKFQKELKEWETRQSAKKAKETEAEYRSRAAAAAAAYNKAAHKDESE